MSESLADARALTSPAGLYGFHPERGARRGLRDLAGAVAEAAKIVLAICTDSTSSAAITFSLYKNKIGEK